MRSDRNPTTVAMHAVLRRVPLVAAFILGFLATGGSVMAQTLDDFRRAAAGDGVNVIPFERLRREATSVADEVERRKRKATQWNYATYENMKQNLLKKKADKQEEIETKEDEIELGEENYKIQEEGAKNTEQKFRNLITLAK